MFKKVLLAGLLCLFLPLVACFDATTAKDSGEVQPFTTGAIPDQDPEKLQRLYDKLTAYLEAELAVPVEYKPVSDYAAAVTAFKVGDLDLVWFGGLTGVQARLQVPGTEAIAQRDIDEKFTSVFIAHRESGITEIEEIAELKQLQGHTFTFGSESSTSGRLMPQHFLAQGGVSLDDFKGEVGFSGSHDATINLVEAGTYDAGALNSQVWQDRLEGGEVDLEKVQVIWTTPTYYDYHWVINPEVEERYGAEFVEKVKQALFKLDPQIPEHQEILELFGAKKFIPTDNSNYTYIEAVGREIGKIE